MKKQLHITGWLLAMLMLGVTNLFAQSDNSAVYTSNVTLSTTGGTSASTAKVKISNTEYDALKAGTGSVAGAVKIKVPAGAKYLHLHVAGWNKENVTLSVTPTGYSSNISLKSNSGVSGNSPFTLSGDLTTSDYYKVITFANALTEATDLTFTATSGKRFVVWGVNSESESGSEEPEVTIPAPVLSPKAGSVEEGTVVNITNADGSYMYFYTADGSEPQVVDLEGQGTTKKFPADGVVINETTTLKVVAVDEDGNTSTVVTAQYDAVKIEDGVFDFGSKAFDYGTGLKPSSANTFITENYTWTAGNVTLVTSGKYRWWSDGTLRLYSNSPASAMTIAVPAGYVITKIAVTGTGGSQLKSDVGEYDKSTGKWVGESQQVVLSYDNSGTLSIQTVTVTYEEAPAPATVSVSVGEAGAATFSSDKALDFTDVEEIQAYIATVSGNNITFTRVNKVPANTGLLLRNAKGVAEGAVEPVDVPVLADEPEEFGENALVAVAVEIASLATEETGSQYVNYILNNNDGNLGFYRAADKKVAAGKAYLKVEKTVAQSREFISIDDTATSIGKLNVQNAGQTIYDLQGRRVQNPVRGLYIIGNRKVVVK